MTLKPINVLIDERPISAQLGYTILQTCANAGVDVPRFCYHDKLLIAGNCRICLVEVTGSKKLVASCAVHVSDKMSIYTNTARVRLARQNVLEFLLANHPLDCPICDQGGECDLQDITALFGADRGRFYETEKRAVLNKDFGPLIRTSMNRCIHCTRCVRFLTMSSGVATLGTLGRGSATEIGTYINQFISDELSGNITDLCPVGALTSKPYSFKARPWELVSVKSVDIFDSLNSTLTFDVMANKICRVLPYANEALNECWLTNKARYAYDGLFSQRLNACLLRLSVEFFVPSTEAKSFFLKKRHLNAFVKLSWSAAFFCFFTALFTNQTQTIKSIIGNYLDLESTYGLNFFLNSFGVTSLSYGGLEKTALTSTSDWSFLYLFNTALLKLSRLPSFCLFFATNLRLESPLLNFRINQLIMENNTPIFRVGGSANYFAYKTRMISNTTSTLYEIFEFRHVFCKNFYLPSFSNKPFILAAGTLSRIFGNSLNMAIMSFVRRLLQVQRFSVKLREFSLADFSYFGFLHQYSAALHFLSLGVASVYKSKFSLTPAAGNSVRTFLYSIGFEVLAESLPKNSNNFFIYQGTHGLVAATSADLILPVVSYVEKICTFKNLLGVSQRSEVVIKYEYGARTDLEVFKGLLAAANKVFANFFSFSFSNGLRFNTALLVGSSWLSSELSFFLKKKRNHLMQRTIFRFFYLGLYGSSTALFFADLPNLVSSAVDQIFSNYLGSTTVNYYSDRSSPIISSSKTMALSANLSFKKSSSFSEIYY